VLLDSLRELEPVLLALSKAIAGAVHSATVVGTP